LNVGGSAQSFLKFDLSTLPAVASGDVVKATLTVFVGSISAPGEIDVKRVTTGPWDEAHITGANAPSVANAVEDSAPNVAAKKIFLSFNVTALVKDWVGNVLPNNGIALVTPGSAKVTFNSKENSGTAHPATLEISVATAAAAAPPCAGNDAQDIMVKVGATCVDVYEASVWSTPTGGTQYGATSADYPCNEDGSDCTNTIYARSVQGVLPSANITWLQAQRACANSGKRLLRNAEWQMAATGTPPGVYDGYSGNVIGTDNGTTDCNSASNTGVLPEDPVLTGSRANCVSSFGAFDMVGNVNEYVGEMDGSNGNFLQVWLRGGNFYYGSVFSGGSVALDPARIHEFWGGPTNEWGFRCGR